MGKRFRECLLSAGATALLILANPTVQAQTTIALDLPEQPLADSLRMLGKRTDTNILIDPELVKDLHAPAIKASLTTDEALTRLLSGTGISYRFIDEHTVVLKLIEPRASVDPVPPSLDEVVITGSHIRGAPSSSPVVTLTQEGMRNSGLTNLGDVIRNIPQNFSGGQNPGVGMNVPESIGSYLGSGSGLNLRGLGGDATLTLLNGHRLAYNAAAQSVDISAIPMAAVERIEIVADGASALYGSDAVAGVGNVILKRNYDGVNVTARYGASTDGGNEQQQYGIAAGTTWNSGGIIAVYDFEDQSGVLGRNRSYTRDRPDLTLFPALKRHALLVSGHQALSDRLTFEADALYNRRLTDRRVAFGTGADYQVSGSRREGASESFVVAPTLRFELTGQWSTSLTGMFGVDKTFYGLDNYTNRVIASRTRGCYCNEARSAEINADGALFSMPGGDAKVALGGGYRSNEMHAYRRLGPAQNIQESDASYYGFAELNLPLVSAAQGIAWVKRLNLSAAVRYENYPGVDHIATPKLGVIYSPSLDFDIKGSWGKSFKAPTLYQRYSGAAAEIDFARYYGGTDYPASSTAIFLYGGNPDLKPERATTWAATFALHPQALAGASVELSYFHIAYEDRVVAPINFGSRSLSNPMYQNLVDRTPTPEEQLAAFAGRSVFNYTELDYDPASIVAIINDSNTNAATQAIHGVDLSVAWRLALGSYGSLALTGNGSYIKSEQQLSSGQPKLPLASTLFSPPAYRGQLGATWDRNALTLTSYINYIGSVKDVRSTPAPRVGSMTTVDLSGGYAFGTGGGVLENTTARLSIQNLFNERPSPIAVDTVYSAPYDSTNYSAIGRFVSFELGRQW